MRKQCDYWQRWPNLTNIRSILSNVWQVFWISKKSQLFLPRRGKGEMCLFPSRSYWKVSSTRGGVLQRGDHRYKPGEYWMNVYVLDKKNTSELLRGWMSLDFCWPSTKYFVCPGIKSWTLIAIDASLNYMRSVHTLDTSLEIQSPAWLWLWLVVEDRSSWMRRSNNTWDNTEPWTDQKESFESK